MAASRVASTAHRAPAMAVNGGAPGPGRRPPWRGGAATAAVAIVVAAGGPVVVTLVNLPTSSVLATRDINRVARCIRKAAAPA